MMKIMSHLSYIGVGIVSLALALFVASRVVRPSYSQNTPTSAPAGAPARPALPPRPTPTGVPSGVNAAAPTNQPAPSATDAAGDTPQVISENVSFLEPYVFDLREGRRNPFRLPLQADGSAMDIVLPGTPLERYDIEELKLAGIMWDVRAPKAMIVDPQGEVHILGKDDRIGRKRGYVAVIREGEVVVVETTTFNGESTYSTRILRIDK